MSRGRSGGEQGEGGQGLLILRLLLLSATISQAHWWPVGFLVRRSLRKIILQAFLSLHSLAQEGLLFLLLAARRASYARLKPLGSTLGHPFQMFNKPRPAVELREATLAKGSASPFLGVGGGLMLPSHMHLKDNAGWGEESTMVTEVLFSPVGVGRGNDRVASCEVQCVCLP